MHNYSYGIKEISFYTDKFTDILITSVCVQPHISNQIVGGYIIAKINIKFL